MSLIVTKFGGTSMASAAQLRKVAGIVLADPARRFVVPSAPGKRFAGDTKVTDLLYHCYDLADSDSPAFRELFDKIRARYQSIIDDLGLKLDLSADFMTMQKRFLGRTGSDYAASRGEYLAGKVLAHYLGMEFIDAAEVVAFDVKGQLNAKLTQSLMSKRLAHAEYAVIPGFYGQMPDGSIKTFSRGGSDISGSLVARGCQADVYENWTDVSGFLVADPRIVKDPTPIRTVTYRELRELSYMGANVLHEDSIFPARKAGVPINIRNTNAPDDPGTMIVAEVTDAGPRTVTGIAGKKGFTIISVEKDRMNAEIGFGRRVLQVLEDFGLAFEHLPSGIDTMCVVINTKDLGDRKAAVLEALQAAVDPDNMECFDGVALIAVVGRNMRQSIGTAARVFKAVAAEKVNVRMIDQGSSELNLIIGVDETDFEKAIRAIYDEFYKGKAQK